VTEAVRVPSWQEIVEVHTIARRIAEDAERLMDTIDWPSIEKISDQMLEGGRRFYDNIMEGLSELGVDMEDPLQLLLSVRRLGAVEIESRFGVGEHPKDESESYRPVIPTDTLQDFINQKNRILVEFSGKETQVRQNAKIIVGSTDVHEYGMLLVVEALQSLNIEPIVAGISVDPDEFADLALEAGATAILISTHNGMALTYAEQLLHEFKQRRLSIPIGMGGTLNQDFEGQPTPVDVRDDLVQLGVFVCNDVPDMMAFLNKDK
jgi:methylmalonyl-CoA mutase cobalamin-binding subunit